MSGMFRTLRADEIEVRVAAVRENGVQLLLYKTARTDSTILDETVGSENWQCRFYEVAGATYCSLGVRFRHDDGTSEWIWKDDAGSEGNIEKEKSTASSAFKRAGFKFGIGKELYTAPFIWVPADRCEIRPGKNGRPQCFDRFHVEKVRIEDGRITAISIWNDRKACRAFVWQEQPKNA